MSSRSSYESRQIEAFSALVDDGTYSEKFDHAPHAQKFFGQVMSQVLSELGELSASSLRILDAGCGNGAWLDFLLSHLGEGRRMEAFGFDLTPEMVTTARKRLASMPAERLWVGSVIDAAAYTGPDQQDRYHLLMTYDVVQQLPRQLQFEACELLAGKLAPGGVAVIFDNDCDSEFGRKMGRKKFLTRYFGLRLVPRYYCNAHYPPLDKFSDRLRALGFTTEIRIADQGPKRALLIRMPTDGDPS